MFGWADGTEMTMSARAVAACSSATCTRCGARLTDLHLRRPDEVVQDVAEADAPVSQPDRQLQRAGHVAGEQMTGERGHRVALDPDVLTTS